MRHLYGCPVNYLDEILGDFGHALDVDLLDASAVDTTINFVNAMADDLPPQVFKGPMFQEEYNFSKVPVLPEAYRKRHKPINPEIEYLRLKNSYPKFLPALKFEDVWQSLCEFEDERMSQSDVRPPSADKGDDDEEFMAKKAEVNKIMNKLEQRFVPLSEIHELPPAQSYSQAQVSSAVRPVNEFEVQKHMKHLRQYGFVAPGAVTLCTPGPSGYKYGIIDGQHRVAALQRLMAVEESSPTTSNPGNALKSCLRDGCEGYVVPALVLEDPSPDVVIAVGIIQNGLYKHGDSTSAYAWLNLVIMENKWATFPGSRLHNVFMWSSMRGPITSDKEECLGNIKKLQVMSGNDMKMSQFESIYRTACRMWFLSLDKPLASQLFDPFQKKRDLAFEGWGKCFEVLQNYFQFFSHCCLWSNEEVHKMLVKMLQVFLLVPNGFQPEPLDPEKLSTTASQKYILLKERGWSFVYMLSTRKAAFPTTLRDAYEVNAQHLVGYLNTNDVNTIKIANDERFIRAQKAKNKNEAEKIKRLREQIAKAEALEAKKRKDDEEKERQRKIDEEAHALQALEEENRLRQESEAQREKKRKRDAILSKEARQELGDDQPRKFRRLRRARSKGMKV
ncbi:hypothetical protein DYB35_013875 [Aphanomyces astaci]|uniref:ParB/Sulfiredoxin domain-containing protein n=1 Tax=Aphanomyces astaci TaxID=112090 RepID=A0A418CU15_APHAT|nr:hypothetical protein DYB35_013875 [Aphanomyces astaci]